MFSRCHFVSMFNRFVLSLPSRLKIYAKIGGVSMGDACEYTLDIVRGATKRMLGPLHPGFRLVTLVRNILTESLPPDTYVKASGKVYISLTSITDGRNVLVTDFSSNEELIDAVVCSSFIPVFSGYIPPKVCLTRAQGYSILLSV